MLLHDSHDVQILDDSALEAELMEARYAAEQIELAEREQAEREAFMQWANEQNACAEADAVRERQMREAYDLLRAAVPAGWIVSVRREEKLRDCGDGDARMIYEHRAMAYPADTSDQRVVSGDGDSPMTAAHNAVADYRRSQQKPAA
jgi:hypothetical protein